MKGRTSSLDLHYLTEEFQSLVGCRVNKVYQMEDTFLFQLHKPGEGKRRFRVTIPDYVYRTKYKPDFPDHPPEFCMFLRKYLSNSIITSIEQHGFDRILELRFETDETYILVVELFSKGNAILCDAEWEIISPMDPQSWGSRTIRGGTTYEYPPKQVDTASLDLGDVEDILVESDMDAVVKLLAAEFGLGGEYAEEACARTDLEKDAHLDDVEPDAVYDALRSVLDAEVQANSVGMDVYPFVMETADEPEEYYASFNEAVDEVVSRKLVEKEAERARKHKEEKIEEVERVLEKQRQSIEKLKADVRNNKRKGEVLFERYQDVQRLLESFREDKESLSWDALREKYEAFDYVDQVHDDGTIVIDV
jgi:predicted ribosome quality control (RQC) complex YloA/Tae2 family protein